MLNALSIDVEDYFQVSNFEKIVKKEDWDAYECRVLPNTRKLLDILSSHNVRATFFILGWVADKYPELIKEIDYRGHEIASHGYWHRLVYKMTPGEFEEDLSMSLKSIEGITKKKVKGFRAPSWSINKDSSWAMDILKDSGMQYDSSVFPAFRDKGGMPDANRFIYHWGNGLLEFPCSTVRFAGANIPVAGGGYFRLYHYNMTKWAIENINKEGHPAMVYIHPWEIDPDQPRLDAGPIAGFRHYVNMGNAECKLEKLLTDFTFMAIEDIFTSKG
ncbi:MAG TPA: DUF3473 domain-containing protein [Candidatus Omnitrophota bacterium]|nr:DUF3473 domain-containing protein [Candidatus Omnitrophota bacterium]